jgi:hypothetical protein
VRRPDEVERRLESVTCEECSAESWDAAGWQGHLTAEEPREVVLYCPECAGREFGSDDPV